MTQHDYLIEKLAQQNARLHVEIEKANFTVIALQEKIDELEAKVTEMKGNEEKEEAKC